MAAQKKVLITGDVKGKLSALFRRVQAINKANGPFDLLLCVGGFFPECGPEDDAAEADAELADFAAGQRTAPLPTYFIGGFGRGAQRFLDELDASGGAANVHYLGRAGLTSLAGLSIAFLDGRPDAAAFGGGGTEAGGCRHFTQADVKRLEAAVDAASGDVDIFLTCEWPARVTAAVPPALLPPDLPAGAGSQAVADLALRVRPRYHFAGGAGVHFARPPYLNKNLGAGAHVTRFVALAEFGNASKAKALHALVLVPVAGMAPDALTAKPADTTACPYALPGPPKRVADDGFEQSWRWQAPKRACTQSAAPSYGRPGVVKDNKKTVYVKNLPYAAEEADIVAHFEPAGPVADVRRGAAADGKLHGWGFVQFDSVVAAEAALRLHGSVLMGRELTVDMASGEGQGPAVTGEPVEGCWFCLSNPSADVNLVASIGEESYVALDKGPISGRHVLMLPIEHFPSTLALPPSAYAEIERYLSALRSCFAAQGEALFAFERYMVFRKSGGNHCQVNVLAVPARAAEGAADALQRAAEAAGIALMPLKRPYTGEAGRDALRAVVGAGEFFAATLPDGSRLVQPIPRGVRHPLNFGREVAAALAGVPDRADWKRCQGSEAEEAARTEAFKALFKSFDIMQ